MEGTAGLQSIESQREWMTEGDLNNMPILCFYLINSSIFSSVFFSAAVKLRFNFQFR